MCSHLRQWWEERPQRRRKLCQGLCSVGGVACHYLVPICGVGGHKIKSLRNKKTTIASRPGRLLCPRQGSWAGWSEWRSPCRLGCHNQWSMGHIIRLVARMVKCMESRRDHGGQMRWLICWSPPRQPLIVSPCNSSHSLLFRTKSWRSGDRILGLWDFLLNLAALVSNTVDDQASEDGEGLKYLKTSKHSMTFQGP